MPHGLDRHEDRGVGRRPVQGTLLRGLIHMSAFQGAPGKANNGHVLIVDDAPALKELIVRWLAQNAYRYVFAEDEDQARRLLERSHFDAVLYGHEFEFRRAGCSPLGAPPRRPPGP